MFKGRGLVYSVCPRFFSPGVVMSKSATVSITFELGRVTFLELPDYFKTGGTINGKASTSSSLHCRSLHICDPGAQKLS